MGLPLGVHALPENLVLGVLVLELLICEVIHAEVDTREIVGGALTHSDASHQDASKAFDEALDFFDTLRAHVVEVPAKGVGVDVTDDKLRLGVGVGAGPGLDTRDLGELLVQGADNVLGQAEEGGELGRGGLGEEFHG